MNLLINSQTSRAASFKSVWEWIASLIPHLHDWCYPLCMSGVKLFHPSKGARDNHEMPFYPVTQHKQIVVNPRRLLLRANQALCCHLDVETLFCKKNSSGLFLRMVYLHSLFFICCNKVKNMCTHHNWCKASTLNNFLFLSTQNSNEVVVTKFGHATTVVLGSHVLKMK